MTDGPLVHLPHLVGGQAESWAALVSVAPSLGENWVLVGGQMVFLHEVERGVLDVRPTDDVDVVVDVRVEPSGLALTHNVLDAAGFARDPPDPDGVAHRYRRQGAVFDVLAPDNLGPRARLALGIGRTLQAPGTTQAFRRSAAVQVVLADRDASGLVRRPTLVGSIVGKASAALKVTSQSPASRAKHLRDLDSLGRLLGPADRQTADLTKSEKTLIRRLLGEEGLSDLAVASLELLLGPPVGRGT